MSRDDDWVEKGVEGLQWVPQLSPDTRAAFREIAEDMAKWPAYYFVWAPQQAEFLAKQARRRRREG